MVYNKPHIPAAWAQSQKEHADEMNVLNIRVN